MMMMVMVVMIAAADGHAAHPGNANKSAVVMVVVMMVVVVAVTVALNDHGVVMMMMVLGDFHAIVDRHARTRRVIGLQLFHSIGNRCQQIGVAEACKAGGALAAGCVAACAPATVVTAAAAPSNAAIFLSIGCLLMCQFSARLRASRWLSTQAMWQRSEGNQDESAQCLRLARPRNGFSFSRSVSRIGVPGKSNVSRSEFVR